MFRIKKSGLYIHIPFCRSKCPYCDFYSVKYESTLAEKYTDRLIEEIKKYNGSFDTIYFGGGTPSIINTSLIGKIINASKNQFDISDDCEITIECNPSKNLERDFEEYRSFGINRISLGMQSARNEERFALGRVAGQNEVAKAVNDAKKAGIYNISLDIMLGTPKQTLASLDETFEFVDKMNVTHISAYMLKIEEGTKFFEMKDRLALPDEDETAQMYLKTVDCLKNLGFNQYEISNFAKPGFESRHNTKYWTLVEYLGIGASAHSFYNGKRFYYDKDFSIIQDGDGGNREEQIMLGLRMNRGIDKSLVNKDYSQFIKMGLLAEDGDRISLTPEGMLLSNTIINSLI
ncbi:MAG: radical SAM family heme chaperone HemW [Eubacterium sp.]|nr:radical SAM family heme chaperone HemW [Eubacterium sp.]